MGSMVLPSGLRAELETLARIGYPNESCGLLLGRREEGCCQVVRQYPAHNLNRERARDRYELDPVDYLAAEKLAQADRLDLIGVWHTHPDHPARPSDTDRELAWAGWLYLIVAVTATGVVDTRCWRLAGDVFAEEDIRDG